MSLEPGEISNDNGRIITMEWIAEVTEARRSKGIEEPSYDPKH